MDQKLGTRIGLVSIALILGGCLEDAEAPDLRSLQDFASANDTGIGTTSNRPPVISGAPQLQTAPGASYVFEPASSDPDGDRLGFSIRNKPVWAEFDPNTGMLSGTPGSLDAGLVTGIVISVSDGRVGSALAPFSILVGEALSSNGAATPTIGGLPPALALVNELYLFTPLSSDADGDALTFSITGKPDWLSFDPASGTISGIPQAGDIGLYANIELRASDGMHSAAFGPFTIEVVSASPASATLSWEAPTENEDGSPLLTLAGYRIRYGTDRGIYPNLVDINNPGVVTFSVDGLSPNTYYFVLTAYNGQGIESGFSNEAAFTLN